MHRRNRNGVRRMRQIGRTVRDSFIGRQGRRIVRRTERAYRRRFASRNRRRLRKRNFQRSMGGDRPHLGRSDARRNGRTSQLFIRPRIPPVQRRNDRGRRSPYLPRRISRNRRFQFDSVRTRTRTEGQIVQQRIRRDDVAAYHDRERRSRQDRHRRRNRIRIAAPDGYRRCGIHLLRCDGRR